MRQQISVTFAYAPSTSRAASHVRIKCHRIAVRKIVIIRFMAFYKMIIYKSFNVYETLLLVTRKILILIHDQAAVKGGFNVNKDMIENFNERTVVAQRQVLCVQNIILCSKKSKYQSQQKSSNP